MRTRIRTVKPEFFTHEPLYLAEIETGFPLRLAFEGLWICADRDGRFRWRPNELKLHILPYDNIDFSRVLDALTTRGFVVQYGSNDALFGYIPSFNRHQVINNREQSSDLPEPTKESIISTRDPRVVEVVKRIGKEGKGTEGKGTHTPTREPRVEDFEQFWASYPRKVGKRTALKAWQKLKPDIYSVLESLERWKTSTAWRNGNGQYIPHPTTWLNRAGWQDDPKIDVKELTWEERYGYEDQVSDDEISQEPNDRIQNTKS